MLGVGFVWRKGQDGDEIRYVGFSHAMEHVCQVKLSHFYRHALDLGPRNYDFRCAELANVGRVFRWLTPGKSEHESHVVTSPRTDAQPL